MSSKALCLWIRLAAIIVAVCALIIYGFILPTLGQDIAAANPEYALWYWPWLIFLWLMALPVAAIIVYVWKVSAAVKQDEVFTLKTARWVKNSAVLLFADAAFFLLGNIVFSFLADHSPGIMLLALFISMFALVLALLAAVLSRYIIKAAQLQEENEGTI